MIYGWLLFEVLVVFAIGIWIGWDAHETMNQRHLRKDVIDGILQRRRLEKERKDRERT